MHLLKVPIKEPYGFIFDELIGMLRPNKTVLMEDYDGKTNTCNIDKEDNIVYSICHFTDDYDSIVMNFPKEFYTKCANNYKKHNIVPRKHIDEIDKMAMLVLDYYKVRFEDYDSNGFDELNRLLFRDLERKYKLGEFKILEP